MKLYPYTQFTKNMLIQWIFEDEEHPLTERILWINPDHSYVYVINVENAHIPIRREVVDIQVAIPDGRLIVLLHDHYMDGLILEEDLTPKQKAYIAEFWPIIEAITQADNGEAVFDKKKRKKLLDEQPVSAKKIERNLFRFWQLGQVPNALAPRFDKRGTGSAIQKPENSRGGGRYPEEAFPITPQVLNLMHRGYSEFYASGKEGSVSAAYQKTIEKFFNDGYREENGIYKPILRPQNQYPSYTQFLRHCHYKRDREKVSKRRDGAAATELNLAPKKGSANQMAFGPGAWFLIDSTPADIHLVSSFNRSWIIGKPTIYFVKDLFSMMIVGYSLTLEEPSWLAQMLALINAATDKVSFCAEYGIHIKESQWPCHYLPQFLLGDRGELASKQATNLIMNLNVAVSNNPPYMPVMKGPVELDFNLANIYALYGIPGGGRHPHRGQKNRKGLPCLTLRECNQAILHYILTYNQAHVLDEYAPGDDQIADLVPSTPLSLWEWGIKNRSGLLKMASSLLIYKSLLPREEGSITLQSIQFKKRHYEVASASLQAEEREWLINARNNIKRVEIAYDIRDMSHVYLCLPDTRFIRCQLSKRDEGFEEKDWRESDQYQQKSDKQKKALNHQWRQYLTDMHAELEIIIADAEAVANADREKSGVSKSRLTENVRLYRIIEKNLVRMIATNSISQWEINLTDDVSVEQIIESEMSIALYDTAVDYSRIISNSVLRPIEKESDDE